METFYSIGKKSPNSDLSLLQSHVDSQLLVYIFICLVLIILIIFILSIVYQCVMLSRDPSRLSKEAEDSDICHEECRDLVHDSLSSLFHVKNSFAKLSDYSIVNHKSPDSIIVVNTTTRLFDAVDEDSVYEQTVKVLQILTVISAAFGFVAYLTADHFPQRSSGQTFIKCLAVADSISGFQDGIVEMLLPLIGIDLFLVNEFGCRFLGWCTFWTSISVKGVTGTGTPSATSDRSVGDGLSSTVLIPGLNDSIDENENTQREIADTPPSYILTATAFDKIFALFKPVWYKQNSTPRVANTISTLIWIIIAILTFPIFLEYDLQDSYCNFLTNPWSLFSEYMGFLTVYLFLTGVLMPISAAGIANLVIIVKLRQKTLSVSRSDREVTVSLLVVSISFFICQMINAYFSIAVISAADTDPSLAMFYNYAKVNQDERNYEVATDHTCRVFDNRSAFYTQMGMEDAAIFGYRVCCAANHTSAFSVVTTFNSQKMDSDSLTDKHHFSWMLMIPSAMWVMVLFMVLLYIHDIHSQPEQNLRRLITLFVFNIFVCSDLAAIDKVGHKGACAFGQMGMQFGMLSTVGCLFNELLVLLKEVTPALWRADSFIILYFFNAIIIPAIMSFTSFLLTLDDIGASHSCFIAYDSYTAFFLIYTPLALYLIIGQIVVSFLIYRNANKLSRQMEEYDIPDELREIIFRARLLLFLFPPIFGLYPFLISKNSEAANVGLGVCVLFQSFILCCYLLLLPAENLEAWIELRSPIQKYMQQRRKKSAKKHRSSDKQQLIEEQKRSRSVQSLEGSDQGIGDQGKRGGGTHSEDLDNSGGGSRPPSQMSEIGGKAKTSRWLLDSSRQDSAEGGSVGVYDTSDGASDRGGRDSMLSNFTLNDLSSSPSPNSTPAPTHPSTAKKHRSSDKQQLIEEQKRSRSVQSLEGSDQGIGDQGKRGGGIHSEDLDNSGGGSRPPSQMSEIGGKAKTSRWLLDSSRQDSAEGGSVGVYDTSDGASDRGGRDSMLSNFTLNDLSSSPSPNSTPAPTHTSTGTSSGHNKRSGKNNQRKTASPSY
ncbi:uncharacterized protein LOC142341239 [Convolutriloba macropyga]|uniref:uncharacterized protein LOC142341239 n=1 Tax=Convolutriloba macropyga TaxID=536237 RepID=UPI003F51DB8F